VKDLLYALLVSSANDSAEVLAPVIRQENVYSHELKARVWVWMAAYFEPHRFG
jgi:D-alanyl-D-alanine carboxypeptidase